MKTSIVGRVRAMHPLVGFANQAGRILIIHAEIEVGLSQNVCSTRIAAEFRKRIAERRTKVSRRVDCRSVSNGVRQDSWQVIVRVPDVEVSWRHEVVLRSVDCLRCRNQSRYADRRWVLA